MNESLTLTKLFNLDAICGVLSGDTTYVGIDFGTSTTVVSIAVYNPVTEGIDCRSLQLAQKDKFGAEMYGELFPTVLAINPVTQGPIYGQGAYDLKCHPDYSFGVNLWHSFKMELGKDLGPRWYDSQQSKIKSPQDATRAFFKFLKNSIGKTIKAEGLPATVKYAVSIPASFESNQRKDLMEALLAHGINVDGSLFIDEPNAAFLGYINSGETDPILLQGSYNPKVLVFDFGAGTCDISLLELRADHNGIHSKNLSISQFAELGGNDIDRYIAHNILLPQLLKANGFDGDSDMFTTREKETIVYQLLPAAENMKKRLCSEDFNYLLSDPGILNELLARNKGITIDTVDLSIPTNGGTLTISQLSLSYADFIEAMKVFFKKQSIDNFGSYTVKDQQKRYNSINSAIDTALHKAHVSENEVDYVIMIGGSSRNPFVQHRIKQMFSRAKVMIPRDIQALVSQGAALHSILSNGFRLQAVRPIVGESIMVATQHDTVPIVKAGTEVPFDIKLHNMFTTGRKTYTEIEIPICVGSDHKMLYNLKLQRANGAPFPPNIPVILHLALDADKILHVEAEAMGEKWKAVLENPLDNAALTEGEEKILKAQRRAYLSAVGNASRPTAEALENLCRAYEDNGQEFLAAETLVEKEQMYPSSVNYNRIGVLFHNSGNYSKAIHYLREAFRRNPENSVICSNLGHDLYLCGEYEEARNMLEKAISLKGDNAVVVTKLARLEAAEDNTDKAQALYQRAFNIFKRKWDADELDDCEKGWFMSVAKILSRYEVVNKLQSELRVNTSSRGYDLNNTLFGTGNV